jgi:hypothetical protein
MRMRRLQVDPRQQPPTPPVYPRRRPARRERPVPTVAPWQVYLGLILCLAVAILLSSGRLVDAAESQEYGPGRDLSLAVARAIDGVAHAALLDRPSDAIDRALGRDDGMPAVANELATPVPTMGVLPTAAAGVAKPGATTVAVAATAPPPAATIAATAMTAPAPTATAAPVAVAPTAAPKPSAPLSAATATPAPKPTAPPKPTVPPVVAGARAVTAEAPLRVRTIGDSFAQPLGIDMDKFAAQNGVMEARSEHKISSGICLPEYYNWPARISQLMAEEPAPEAVVLFLGANDDKVMQANGKKIEQLTPAWREEYTRRAGVVMDLVGQRGATLYWVGMPVMRDKWRRDNATALNESVKAAAASRPWVRFVDLGPLFNDRNGAFTTYRPDASGEQVKVRQDDGIHLTRAGTTWVAAAIYKQLREDFGLPPV